MRLYCCLAVVALLSLGISSYSISAKSLEQFRYDFYDNDDDNEGPQKSSDQVNTRHKRDEDYDSPYDLGMLEDRYRREEDYDSPYDLNMLEGRTKRDEDYDFPYDLNTEDRYKRQAPVDSSENLDLSKRDEDYAEARAISGPSFEPVVPVESIEDIFYSAEENLPGAGTSKQEDFYGEARYGRSDEYDYDDSEDEDYVYSESVQSASSEESKESCKTTTEEPSSSVTEDSSRSSAETEKPTTQSAESYEFEPYPVTTEEPGYNRPSLDSVVEQNYTPPPTKEKLEFVPSEPVLAPAAGSLQDVDIIYDAPNAYSDATLGAQPPDGVVIYPVSSNDLDDNELAQSEALVAPPSAAKEYRIAGNVHLEEVPVQKRGATGRNKRDLETLNEFQQKFLQLFNQYRTQNGLPSVKLYSSLTSGAQNWAESEAKSLELAHSCTECENYSEILAKRRSSRKLPTGIEAAEWVWKSWFEDEEGQHDPTYDSITHNPSVQNLGIGIAYRRAPDRSYHVYAVAWFST